MLFNNVAADLGADYDWVTNPDSGFRYDVRKHWTEIADFSREAGDIKYVWEKSRFSYLYDIIRYDYHAGVDCAEIVFSDILSWIKSNPVNCGPNYRCSQEISLRVMNWTFALYYYRNSAFLTDEVFNQMQYAIYWQMDHVYRNIDFSRIAVRNNHAVTETLGLYFAGLFYPGLPDADLWKRKGKGWFETEIGYQVYNDGTYLQFSMNYHRVVVQLLTWAITLAGKNGERFSEVVYDRAKKSVQFLRTCMVDEIGWLPNYGANDGALFFRLNDAHFRDYRPQLAALAGALGIDIDAGSEEDSEWYGITGEPTDRWRPANGIHSFVKGGYYVIREPDTLTFTRCGNHKDRPSQADNLHIDIWYKGENILPDGGSYKYNADDPTMRYFSGTQSHNTVMLGDKDQMLKGGRFIWYYWSQCKEAGLRDDDSSYVFMGAAAAFGYINKRIVHRRKIIKAKGIASWRVEDEIVGLLKDMEMRQLWHFRQNANARVAFTASNGRGNHLTPNIREGWYSGLYGQKESLQELYFSSDDGKINTTVTAR